MHVPTENQDDNADRAVQVDGDTTHQSQSQIDAIASEELVLQPSDHLAQAPQQAAYWKNQSTSISTGGRGLEHEHRIDHVAAHVRHHFKEHVVTLVLVFDQGILLAVATQAD